MGQLESTTQELHQTSEALRAAEAERNTAGREVERLQQLLQGGDAERRVLQATLRQRWVACLRWGVGGGAQVRGCNVRAVL